ncbi:MAG: CvpA family protein [Ruminococcus sp.]|nr:CvpA family protein [Ruminococcus sp.]
MDNWLLIIVGIVFLLCMIAGGVKGFFRIGISLLSSVITIIIVIYLSPYIEDAIIKYTPLDEMIEERCVEAFIPKVASSALEGKDLSETPLSEFSAEELKKMEEIDWDALGMTADEIMTLIGDVSKEEQIAQIENSAIPEFLKELLIENNNSIIYNELGVEYFPQYVASYITRLAVNIVSFLLTFIFAIIIVRALSAAIDILGDFPVIGAVNHAGGAILGILVAVLVVWLGFLLLTLMYSTEIGQTCFAMIEESKLLTYLYENNILLNKLLQF